MKLKEHEMKPVGNQIVGQVRYQVANQVADQIHHRVLFKIEERVIWGPGVYQHLEVLVEIYTMKQEPGIVI